MTNISVHYLNVTNLENWELWSSVLWRNGLKTMHSVCLHSEHFGEQSLPFSALIKKNCKNSFLKMFESKIDNLYQSERYFQCYIGACTHATYKKLWTFLAIFSQIAYIPFWSIVCDWIHCWTQLITRKPLGLQGKIVLTIKDLIGENQKC